MRAAATELEFERAARLRDRLTAVRRAIERQQMVADASEDLDVIGIAEDELEASVQVFYVRRGRVVGRKGFVVDKVEELTPGGLIDRILESLYGEDPPQGVPQQVLVPVMSDDVALYEEWLGMLRGTKVQIRVPQRGDKRALLETVTRNAKEEFTRHRLRRASDHNTRSRALTELQRYLELPEAPLRIECYDMAHLQGTDYVGSMVVLEDGLPNKREYRQFKVHVPGNDDYAAMEEVLTRRLKAYVDERDRPPLERGEKPGRSPIRRNCSWSTAARASSASPNGSCASSGWRTRSRSPGWPSASRRSTCPVARSRWRSRGGARRCSCCSASATRPTASPTRSTASAGRSG